MLIKNHVSSSLIKKKIKNGINNQKKFFKKDPKILVNLKNVLQPEI